MTVSPRQITRIIEKDLKQKMVLLAGPRQCGKTTLARALMAARSSAYYNWDVQAQRRDLQAGELDGSAKLWVFDELHKFSRWRNWLKGVYDLHGPAHHILVTGSARLDLYSRGGDSLQGRYFLHRLHPFTLPELLGILPLRDARSVPRLPVSPVSGAADALADLVKLGGFPEPLLGSSQRQAARWRLRYGSRLIQDDVRTLETVRELDRLELLYDRLADTVGSVLSINALREDLEVAFETVRKWIAIFERLYVCFRVAPFGAPRIKAVKKEQKLYLWDWARVPGPAARFENLVAMHLLRFQHWCEDVEGARVELRYFRNFPGHEVDFILLKDHKPWMAIEAKASDRPLDASLKYLLGRVKIPFAFQISLHGTKDYRPPDINGCRIRVMPAERFLVNLP